MSKKSIAVIGQGFVGSSLTQVMNERGFDVYVYDKTGKIAIGGKLPEYAGGIAGLVDHCELQKGFTSVYFVCVPTPMYEDGSADLSIVESVLDELASLPITGKTGTGGLHRIAVVKSTVPPGSTESWNKKYEGTPLRVIFCPEFLTEANALDDMRNQTRIVLGGPRPHINRVKQIFQTAFPKVPIVKTSSTTAEMVKYVTNIHLACKVSLANVFYQICNALDANGANIDYDKVIEYATLDARLGTSHWKVPGPMPADDTGEPAMGWAGSCFIKDLNALMCVAKENGVDPKVMRGAWEKNLEVRPQRDWEKLIGRAVSKKP